MRRKISVLVQDRPAFAIAKLRRALWRSVRGCDEVKTPLVSTCVQSDIVPVICSAWPTSRRTYSGKVDFSQRLYMRAQRSCLHIFRKTTRFYEVRYENMITEQRD